MVQSGTVSTVTLTSLLHVHPAVLVTETAMLAVPGEVAAQVIALVPLPPVMVPLPVIVQV